MDELLSYLLSIGLIIMANRFGQLFHITTFGESHGAAVGVVIDGFPAGLLLNLEKIQSQLNRRRPGQGPLTTARQEADLVELLSGCNPAMQTLGSPLTLLVRNQDQRPSDYQELANFYRPSHGDYTYEKKYGVPMPSGGGRASARETVGRVIAGALAEQLLQFYQPTLKITAFVEQVGREPSREPVPQVLPSRVEIDGNPSRTLHAADDARFQQAITAAAADDDSVGGIIRCMIENCPPGLGGPVFDKLEADLAKAMLSIPACRGFEIGSGFGAASMRGSEHNDVFVNIAGRIKTKTNHSGGVQAGISNGETIDFRLAFKPPASIKKAQATIDKNGENQVMQINKGRHDPCVLPRAVPIVESMAAIVLCEHYLQQQVLQALRKN